MSVRFSEDEARQIFARAAERQHAVRDTSEGLTVEELQAIGKEAGLDPMHVAAAVAEMRAAPAAPPARVFGIDPSPRRVRVVPGELTEASWGQLLSRFKRTFGSVGIDSAYGSVREWTSGASSNLHVVAEPVEGGTRITMETRRDGAGVPVLVLPAMGLVLIVMMLGLGAGTGKLGDPAVWLMVLMGLIIGGAGGLGSWRSLRSWAATRAAQFDDLLDEAETILRPVPPEVASRIDPSLLDAEPLGDPEGPARSRSGSERAG